MINRNIELEEGIDYQFELVYIDEVTGLPKDLTNYSAHLTVRPYPELPPEIDLYSDGYGITLGGVSGTIQVHFLPEVSSNKMWDQAPYDLIIAGPSGIRVKLLKGLVTIIPSEREWSAPQP